MDSFEERRILRESLNKALDEAWGKANEALDAAAKRIEGYGRKVWAAAESAEYASLLFSLTYSLENVDPAPPKKGVSETRALVGESVKALELVRKSTDNRKVEDYRNLRAAVYYLRTAYLDLAKKPGKRGSL